MGWCFQVTDLLLLRENVTKQHLVFIDDTFAGKKFSCNHTYVLWSQVNILLGQVTGTC